MQAMSLLLDSEAQFASRAKEIGLPQAVIQNLKDVGVNHLSALAFAARPSNSCKVQWAGHQPWLRIRPFGV